MFTSELGLIKATEKTTSANILVNADFKKSVEHSDRAVVLKEIPVETSIKAVHAALSEFGSIKSIKITLLYTFPVKTNAHDIWDFIGSVSKKTCMINQHSITYAQTKCAIVCFNLAESLNAVIETTSVLRGANLWWSCLDFSKYTKYEKIGHTSLGCSVCGSLYSEMKSTLPVTLDIEKKFAVLESSLTSLMGQISELAKRLDSLVPAVSQSSSGF
ncbi:hypothetical protein G9A89_016258 [Geosiphon pyriformis]|nr:hypothetical protein G9A89_016258 [Geosiphon pyriformis]